MNTTNEIQAASGNTFVTLTKSVLVYKKVRCKGRRNGVVALLEIPKGTTIFKGYNGGFRTKCRAEKARVHGFFSNKAEPLAIEATTSIYNPSFTYRVGKFVRPVFDFSMSRWECASGIHFFATFEEAAEYNL